MKAFSFYALAFGLAVAVSFAAPVIGEASNLVTMLTPAIAAGIMLAFIAPEGGFRDAMNTLGLTSAGLKGWPFAIAGPVLINVVAVAILVAAQYTNLAAPEGSATVGEMAFNVLTGLAVVIVMALCEEVGWRGYMLPRLMGFGTIGAMLIVGFLHGVWHLPLMLTTDYYHATGNPWIIVPLFLLTLTMAGVFYGYLRLWTGSIWPVALAHAAQIMAWNISADVSETKSPIVLEYIGGESGLLMIAGLLIVNVLLVRRLAASNLSFAVEQRGS
jgi:membrane protease YdiL (CAAX protease family)